MSLAFRRPWAALALVGAFSLPAAGQAGAAPPPTATEFNCPELDDNVDCWSAVEGFCPNHCNTACTM